MGWVEKNTFKKNVEGSKHFLKKPPAIAFDKSTIKDAQKFGATLIEVYDKETHRTYRASMDKLWEAGIHIDRGQGQQLALPFRYWDIDDPNAPAHNGEEKPKEEKPEWKQGKLF